MTTKTRTPEQAREWLRAHGICQKEFAESIGVPRLVVVDLLRGRIHGHYGAAHKAAVALGLKPSPDPSDAPPLPRISTVRQPKARRAS